MSARATLLTLQHAIGVGNAYYLVDAVVGDGWWVAGLVSFLCLLMTARWKIPPRPAQ